jgi:two-component system, chemotaxis family, response regulator Rcp1
MKLNPNVLIVEDNPGDVRLFMELLNESNISNNIYVAKDGETAIQMLHNHGKYSNLPRPDLILLDMSLPIKDGKDVLRDIKQDKSFDDVSIIILTGYLPDIENHPCDEFVDAAFFKPNDLDGYNELKKSIVNILNKKNKILIN